ncbi:unnamed protein product, partial [Ixodes hexagonus]
MIGARGDKCIRIKTHPSHSIIDSVHEWERDGLFPVLRKERRAQDAVVVVSGPRSTISGCDDGATSPGTQGSNRSRHQQVLPPLPTMAPRRSKDFFFPAMIPDPDYSDSEEEQDPHRRRHIRMPGMATSSLQSAENVARGQMGEDGLIAPRKPPNPCAESAERKNLHKELLFNQKIGKNVLGQKTELQKAMEKMKEEQKRKELEEERQRGRTALEKRLEEQANKLKLVKG